MKSRKSLVIFALTSFALFVGASIYAVMSYSEEQFREQSLQTLEDSEGRDNHQAVGENLLAQDFEWVLNNDEGLNEIVSNNEVTVVNFFASWCGPCKRETPDLNQYYIDNMEEPVEVVGVNIDDSVSNRDEFLEEYGVQYPIYELEDEDEALASYNINLMPTTFFLNNEGEIIRAYIGEVSPQLLESYIDYVKEAS